MAAEYPYITHCGSFNIAEKQALIKTFRTSAATVTPTAAPTALTNSTAGTANDIVQATPQAVNALTGADTATLPTTASVNAALTIVNNNFADLTVKLNALRTALVNSGVLT